MIRLVLLARAPIPGKCKTRLAQTLGQEKAAEVYQAMLQDTLERFETLGDERLLLATPEDQGVQVLRGLVPGSWHVDAQHGGSFEARLLHAWNRGAKGGASPVLMGTDAPHIDRDALQGALEDLDTKQGHVVMGPARDGGYYVIGAAQADPRLLTHMPWSTPDVAAETRRRCAHLGLTLHCLPASFDVDTEDELSELAQVLKFQRELAPRTAELLATWSRD